MAQKEYRGYNKSGCDFMGCKKHKITVEVTTYHDSGEKDRDLKFCTESHAASFLVLYARLEEAGWHKENMPSQKQADEVEGVIEELMEDYK